MLNEGPVCGDIARQESNGRRRPSPAGFLKLVKRTREFWICVKGSRADHFLYRYNYKSAPVVNDVLSPCLNPDGVFSRTCELLLRPYPSCRGAVDPPPTSGLAQVRYVAAHLFAPNP
jgi:hypothetical protein